MSFADDVKRFTDKTVARERDVFVRSVKETHEAIVMGSPLTGASALPANTGYFRATVQVSAGDSVAFTLRGDNSDNTGTKDSPMPMTRMDSATEAALRSGQVNHATIATNHPGAPAIEDRHPSRGKGWASARSNWDRIVEKNVREIVGGGG